MTWCECVYIVWYDETKTFCIFHFSFFHKSKKCWRSYAYAHVMNHWWCMTCCDFLFKSRWWCMHECVDAWVRLMRLLFAFLIFPFFHKPKKCWRSYAYAHIMNHWWCMTCYDFLFKPRRWCMHGCVDAWVEFALFKKMNYSCMHDLIWCMNFSFAFFWKQYSNWFSFHYYF